MDIVLHIFLALISFQDQEIDRLFADLDSAEASGRIDAYQKLAAITDPKVSARLRKTLPMLLDQWSKKAAAERTRAHADLVSMRKKTFDAKSFPARQKEALKLLKAETIERMESLVREMMEYYYPNALKCEEDEKVAETMSRLQELARFVDELEHKGKPVMEDKIKVAQRLLDEEIQIQVMPDKDQKIMKDNAAIRGRIQEEEYRQVFITNQYRVLLGKNALKLNTKLCAASRDHSKDMKEKGFFEHDSPVPGKRTAEDRAKRQGAKASGENIAHGQATGETVFWVWVRSVGHNENMLENYAEMGAGTYESFWTQMFN